jgi:putative transposase
MTHFRRLLIPGATYFFTVRLERRGDTLLTDHIESLRYAYAKAVQDYPVTCHAMVVLPDHLHAVWTEPDGGVWYSERWRRIKARFAQAIPQPPIPCRQARSGHTNASRRARKGHLAASFL